ncbi:MAG: flagellar hook-length control protein FliK [Gammaproteobacteria bacterium]
MEINLNPANTTLTVTTPPAGIRNWQVGQVLKAVATGTSEGGQATLRSGSTTFNAQLSFPVKPGQTFMLEVVSIGSRPLLRILSGAPAPAPLEAIVRQALPRQSGLAPLLANLGSLVMNESADPPLPGPLQQLLRNLWGALPRKSTVTTAAGLRRAVQDAGTFMEAKLARAAAEGRPAPIASDFKAALLRLHAALRQQADAEPSPPRAPAQPTPETPAGAASRATARDHGNDTPLPQSAAGRDAAREPMPAAPRAEPPASRPAPDAQPERAPPRPTPAAAPVKPLLPPLQEALPQAQARVAPSLLRLNSPQQLARALLTQTDGALARLHLSQVASHTTGTDSRHVWLLEVPVRRQDAADVLHLRIARDDAADTPAASARHRWTVELALDLPGLGPVKARVGVAGEQVATTFWAAHERTAQLFRGSLSELRRQLQDAGLEVAALDCHTGLPQPSDGPADGPDSGLLDERV